jgi:hypothetical protein
MGYLTGYWTSTGYVSDPLKANAGMLESIYTDLLVGVYKKHVGYSVRCIKE